MKPLQPCSTQKKKKKSTKKKKSLQHNLQKKKKEVTHVPSLLPCSSGKSKKNRVEVAPSPSPLGITNTTTTSTVKTIFNKAAEEKEGAYKKIRIYFCTTNAGGFDWYKVNPKKRTNHSKDPHILNPISRMPSSTLPDFCITAVGSKLYAIGGNKYLGGGCMDQHPSSQFYVCDTSSKLPVWEESFPSMASPRKDPTAVNVNGNIFVFGSQGAKQLNDPWSEVFDTESNTWNRLAPPPSLPPYPSYRGVVNSVFVQERGEAIVLMDYKQLYCFNVKSLSWKKIPVSVPHDPISTGSLVVVDDILYWFYNANLWALDMSRPDPSPKVVGGLEEETSDHITDTCKGHLFYIGEGKLCLLWYRCLQEPSNLLVIHCLRFWVVNSNSQAWGPLWAVIDRRESYCAQGRSASSFVAISGEKL